MCNMWFVHDYFLATWVYMLETVCNTVKRLWKSQIAPFSAIIITIIIIFILLSYIAIISR